jgi:ABC-type lipoprotein release transport system permease subunit
MSADAYRTAEAGEDQDIAATAQFLQDPVGLVRANLGRGLGFGPIPSHPDAAGVAALLPVLVLVSVVGALLPARRAARLSVAEALRAD